MSTTPSRRAARRPAEPPTAEVAPAQEPTLGELVGNLSRDMTTLVRQELELARTEIKEELGRTSRAGGMLGGTALAGYLAVLMASFAVAWGLAEVMPTGLAFLIVGIVYAVAAYFLYQRGRQELKQVRPVPEQTIETLKEDAEWARQRMR
ncbi:MAG: phage holin family protein [Actinobacteria bacterium]|nr:phage holin family protein [Actinomycetota bacterium]MBW3649835.1 phage holin family protein [Actinomycetota bacterium]